MSRHYTLTHNPFSYGFKHESLAFTDKVCGLKTQSKLYGSPVSYKIVYYNEDPSYASLTRAAKVAYYGGRSIRFLGSVVGSIIEVIVQIVQCFFTTIELLLVKAEEKIRGCHSYQTKFHLIHHYYSITRLCILFRNHLTGDEPSHLANDFGFIPDYESLPTLSFFYRRFLHQQLNIRLENAKSP